ncbi:MAG TPA: hypothetical protein VL918_12100, partial [Sphingobium sp.]|nr:hypothetical protein [Sphingobium sp.]
MSGPPAIRQNNDIARLGEESQADAQPLSVVPGKWRRLTIRLGAFEIGYASVKIAPQHPRQRERSYPVTLRRTSLSGRLVEHLGLTIVALLFLGGVISVLAMRSDAFVSASANRWPIVDAVGSGAAPDAKADAVTAALPEKEQPTPVPVAVTLQPSIVRAAIREGLADLARNGARGGRPGIPSASAVGQAPAAEVGAGGIAGGIAAMTGPLDRIPAVAAAIKRAMTTGEVQNWTAEGME